MESATQFFETIKLPRFEKEQALRIVSIAAATAVLYQSYRYITAEKTTKKSGIKEIPLAPSCYPIVGHAFSLGRISSDTVRQWHKECGPIIKMKLGKRVWITIADPVLAHKVLVTHGAQTAYRPHTNFSHKLFSGGGKQVSNKAWNRNRAAAASILQPKQVEKHVPFIKEEGVALVQRLLDYAERNGTVDPFYHLKLNYLNCIFGKCFGKTFKNVEDEEFLVIAGMVEDSMRFIPTEADVTNYFPFLENFDFLNGGIVAKMRELMNKRHPLFMQYLKETRSREGHNYVKALDESEFDLSDDHKLLLLFEMVTAGSDNLAITTNWLIAMLCHQPEVQARVHQELDLFVSTHGRLPELKERAAVPYVFAAIREAMRWRAATFFGLNHSVIEDLVVDGYLFPKDSIINADLMSLHMDPNFYKNPEEFNPERFLPNAKSLHAAASGKLEERDTFVFGFGRRLCPGIHLAEAELFYTITQMLASCLFEPASDELPDINTFRYPGANILPMPFQVKITKRANSVV
ncbi:cytochrome P450 [Mucor lusitanicus]|uniref:Cytochrome P450 n=1 Tax=Mucor circinelloides f. lusitanicus TaxID=29924 RepID=A0A8H4F2D1_MUCCL|nr:cytochrome P450 [Mucor lusitanicus]